MGTIFFGTVTSEANLLTTELNSLANATLCTLGSAITTADTDIYANIKLTIAAQGSARSANAACYLWLVPESDGVYGDATEACLGTPDAVFGLDAATTARVVVKSNVLLPNSAFKAILKNSTGQTLAASGNLVEIESYAFATA